MKKTNGYHPETGFAAAFIERSGGNIAGEVAAERGELVVYPEREFGAVPPEEESPENKDGVTEAS
ncbi:MAG: hypothetical protein WBL63_17200 [Candidatus Acidiferrum sp.]